MQLYIYIQNTYTYIAIYIYKKKAESFFEQLTAKTKRELFFFLLALQLWPFCQLCKAWAFKLCRMSTPEVYRVVLFLMASETSIWTRNCLLEMSLSPSLSAIGAVEDI